jgi:serine/threonine protein kinase/class 3 adenylate cyclase
MLTQTQTESLKVEMAHILSLDVVGFSTLSIREQRELLRELQQTVTASFEFVRVLQRSQLKSLHTGSGMDLVFSGDLELAVRCALHLDQSLRPETSRLKVRMGIHTGLVYSYADLNSNRKVAGGGISIAESVMECGDSGHILLSAMAAQILRQLNYWAPKLHDLGEVELEPGHAIQLFNLYGQEFGNQEVPNRLQGKPRAEVISIGAHTSKNNDAMIGQQVSHYRIIKKLGGGGMGVVYEARDQRLGRRVALKFLPEDHYSKRSSVERFLHEARAASSLSHPNICTVHDVDVFQGQNFIVMELLQGQTLKHLMGGKRLTPEEIIKYGLQIADALECAHSAGIIHRDIKPANLMVTSRGQLKVLDFGLAKSSSVLKPKAADHGPGTDPTVEDNNLTGPGEFIGTVPYMSPEQACGRPLDARSDLFSFGVVLYEMATGTLPFRGETSALVFEAILNRVPTSPLLLNPTLPQGLERIVNKALGKRPELRYQSAAETRTDLECALAPENVISTAEPVVEREPTGEVVLLYKRNAHLDEEVLNLLEGELRKNGYQVFVDRHLQVGMESAREIERRVTGAGAVIVLLSAAGVSSELLAHELEIAHEAAKKRGRPYILPVRIDFDAALPDMLAEILDGIQYSHWRGTRDNSFLVREILTALKEPPVSVRDRIKLETIGGAVPVDSQFYVVRPTDQQLHQAIKRKDSVILIKGARQMGKTSLMARGLHEARKVGAKIVVTDFQKLNSSHFESVDKLFLALAGSIADQLDIEANPADLWNPRRGPSMNFERFLKREVLSTLSNSLIWGMDEIDRLFSCSFGTEVFGLFRSWHNERSLDPDGPLRKLTMAIAYASEAHMFIRDMNQSPFNVGTPLSMMDFTKMQVSELNRRYGSPLRDQSEIDEFYDLVGGQPYLTRRGLHELASHNLNFSELVSCAASDGGPFGDHLRRLLVSLAEDSTLHEAVRGMLIGRQSATPEIFYRLRSSGLVAGESAREMKPRCHLYALYWTQHLL